MSDNNNEVESLAELVRDTSQLLEHDIHGSSVPFHYMVLNEQSKVMDLDKYLPAPRRTKREFTIRTLDSFVDYVNQYKKDHTAIFAQPMRLVDATSQSEQVAEAFIDYHGQAEPGWCEHKIKLFYETTPEWRRWLSKEDRRMSQRLMINWLKDNANAIVEPDMTELVTEISTLTVNASGKLVATEGHLQAGRAQEKMITVNAALPELMKIQLTPVVGGNKYQLSVRFNVIPDFDEREVEFSYNIVNRDDTAESVYNDFCTQMAAIENVKLYK